MCVKKFIFSIILLFSRYSCHNSISLNNNSEIIFKFNHTDVNLDIDSVINKDTGRDIPNVNLTDVTEHSLNDSYSSPKSIDITTKIKNDRTGKNVVYDVNDNNKFIKRCAHYKKVVEFDVFKMANVWQLIYYRVSYNLSCFKIVIRKTTKEERKQNEQVYGNFNNTVDWESCILEIKSNDKNDLLERKHYLQELKGNMGIFDNIVIVKEREDNSTKYILHEESADQWFLVDNMLLMRDCDTGEVVVFSRVPTQPTSRNIKKALKEFGEKTTNGNMECEDGNRRLALETNIESFAYIDALD